MKYKCIKPYVEYDADIMEVGDIIVINNNSLYNITKKVDYNQLYNIEAAKMCLEAITDEQPMDSRHPFQVITDNMFKTYQKKNHDYGNSFEQSLNKHGLIAAVVRIEDKLNRLNSLINKEQKVVDESISDTLLDAANYLIMTKMWLDDK